MYREEKDVTIAYVGDGGTSQGDFHEALNFAAVNKTPNVFIIQNNQYAISTSRKKQTAVGNLAQKALAYGMPGIQVDGNDALAMYAVTKEAIDRARAGEGPTLIEAYTYRIGAHTTSDDPSIYRDDSEVEEWKEKDPISRMFKYLKGKELWDEEKDEAFKKEKTDFVKDTFKEVEDSGLVPIEDVFGHIYETMPTGLKEQMAKRDKEAK
jgi:pyruvate dehydrogenase E1 component alpha subunit